MFRRVSVPCVRCSRLCSAGWLRLASCPACVALDYVPQDGFGFRALRALVSKAYVQMPFVMLPMPIASQRPTLYLATYLSSAGSPCPACVALDYVPQDGFGFRALRALLSTMFRRMFGDSCVGPKPQARRCSRLCSAGWLRLSCPACVQVRTGTKVSEAIHPNSVLMRKS